MSRRLVECPLAQAYFPADDYRAGWRKMKRYLSDEPALRRLFAEQRQTIYPRELRVIYTLLGKPTV